MAARPGPPPRLAPPGRALLAAGAPRGAQAGGLRRDPGGDRRDFPDLEDDLRRRLSVYKTEIHLDPGSPPPTLRRGDRRHPPRPVAELADTWRGVDDPANRRTRTRRGSAPSGCATCWSRFGESSRTPVPRDTIIKRFKALQDLLGDLHDAHVLEAELAEAVETAAAERARKVLKLSLAVAPTRASSAPSAGAPASRA